MRFWDSSALVPLLVREETTEELVGVYSSDEVIAWWLAEVECSSAIARLERGGGLSTRQSTRSFERLDALARSWILVEPHDSIKEIARRLLRSHDLRAADSLQLGAAILVAEQRPSTLEFVCLDRRLGNAAEREGFPLISVGA